MQRAANVVWTREQRLIALNLYCKLPFGKLHKGNPLIIDVARKMGRSSSSLAMKLCNFASLDPVLQARGIKGLPGPPSLIDKCGMSFGRNRRALLQKASNSSTTYSPKMIMTKWIFWNATECGLNGV